METKQKTWEECRNEVAQKYDCSDWEMLMLNLKQPDIRKTEFEVTKEAAELYNQERDQEERVRIDSLHQLNSELIALLEKFLTYQDDEQLMFGDLEKEAKSLLSKSSDGYTKAKD